MNNVIINIYIQQIMNCDEGGNTPPPDPGVTLTFNELQGSLYLYRGETASTIGLDSTTVDSFSDLGNLLFVYNNFK